MWAKHQKKTKKKTLLRKSKLVHWNIDIAPVSIAMVTQICHCRDDNILLCFSSFKQMHVTCFIVTVCACWCKYCADAHSKFSFWPLMFGSIGVCLCIWNNTVIYLYTYSESCEPAEILIVLEHCSQLDWHTVSTECVGGIISLSLSTPSHTNKSTWKKYYNGRWNSHRWAWEWSIRATRFPDRGINI